VLQDGDLDLYVTNTVDGSVGPGERYPNQLFMNENGIFSMVDVGALVTDDYPANLPSWADFGVWYHMNPELPRLEKCLLACTRCF
jgi:hypothetical protein